MCFAGVLSKGYRGTVVVGGGDRLKEISTVVVNGKTLVV
jgi:hypothetical protein